MRKRSNHKEERDSNSGLVVGFVFLILGVVYLIKQMIPGLLPNQLFIWPNLLILIGLVSGVFNKFKGYTWLILIVIGLMFSSYSFIGRYIEIKKFIVPVFFIIIGLLIFNKSRNKSNATKPYKYEPPQSDFTDTPIKNNESKAVISASPEIPLLPPLSEADAPNEPSKDYSYPNADSTAKASQDSVYDDTDFINVNSYFANNERVVTSKNFRGGKVNIAFAGATLDLHNADFNGTIVLDVMCFCGGLELIVPSNWYVKNEASALLGGIEDSRRNTSMTEANKVLILKGTVMMAGLEIKH